MSNWYASIVHDDRDVLGVTGAPARAPPRRRRRRTRGGRAWRGRSRCPYSPVQSMAAALAEWGHGDRRRTPRAAPHAHQREVDRVPGRRPPAVRRRDGLPAAPSRSPTRCTRPIARSDTGYIGRDDRAKSAFAAFARASWGWEVGAVRMSTTTDVSVVIVEALRLAISPGERVDHHAARVSAVLRLRPRGRRNRRGGAAALRHRRRGRSTSTGSSARSRPAPGRSCCATRTTRSGSCTPRERAGGGGRASPRATTPSSSATKCTHPLTQPDAVFTPFLTVSDDARRHGIAAHSASKTWNLAGLKCALFVTGHDRMTERIRSLPDGGRSADEPLRPHRDRGGVPRRRAVAPGRAGGPPLESRAAGRRCSAGTSRMRGSGEPRRELPRPGSTSRRCGWGDDPSERILESAKVALNPGPDFGTEGAGFVRLNFACSPGVLEDAVTRIGPHPPRLSAARVSDAYSPRQRR